MTVVTRTMILLLIVVSPSLHVQAQWIQQPFPDPDAPVGVGFTNESTGFIFGSDCVYRTIDGGAIWKTQDSCLGSGHPFYVLDSETALYQFGYDVHNTGIRRTTNGGASWTTVDTLPALYKDFEFVSRDIGYAAGIYFQSTFIRKSKDGGITWSTVAMFDIAQGLLEGISFITEDEGWAVTNLGAIYHTVDGGVTWALQDFASGYFMSDIQFVTPDSGWVVGGFLSTPYQRTVDGGKTWMADSWDGRTYQRIQMVDSRLGWRIGYCPLLSSGCWGVIERTTDGGVTWTEQELVPNPPDFSRFYSISMVNKNRGWVVGSAPPGMPLLYKTVSGGVTTVDDNSRGPGEYSLSQNYPNPFNPRTNIKFTIPRAGPVELTVHDVLGRKVMSLVNEEKTIGTYTVALDASYLASGVYFYRLRAGSFIQTRKISVIK